jgi:hypothetical protein
MVVVNAEVVGLVVMAAEVKVVVEEVVVVEVVVEEVVVEEVVVVEVVVVEVVVVEVVVVEVVVEEVVVVKVVVVEVVVVEVVVLVVILVVIAFGSPSQGFNLMLTICIPHRSIFCKFISNKLVSINTFWPYPFSLISSIFKFVMFLNKLAPIRVQLFSARTSSVTFCK